MPGSVPLALRDIHLPDTINGWPPAIGWWILSSLLILMMILGFRLYIRYKRLVIKREALNLLKHIEIIYIDGSNDQQLIQSISVLLRRVCISYYSKTNVAGLTGKDWLFFLDENLSKTITPVAFSTGAGQLMLSAPYQKNIDINVKANELLILCQLWLSQLPVHNRIRQ